jgi:hypothetical protein
MSSGLPLLFSGMRFDELRRTRAKPFRALFTPPERGSFKPTLLLASSNLLIFQDSNNRTKTGVVRLRWRKGPA